MLYKLAQSFWLQLLLAVIILLSAACFSRFSEGTVIKTGLNICLFWLLFILVKYCIVDSYWLFLLRWLLSMLAFFVFYYSLIFLCGKYGRPYNGEGGVLMLVPLYLFGFSFIIALTIKGLLYSINFIFS